MTPTMQNEIVRDGFAREMKMLAVYIRSFNRVILFERYREQVVAFAQIRQIMDIGIISGDNYCYAFFTREKF